MEYGGGGPRVFGLVMKLSAKLSEDEYETRLTPVIIRLFASPDRAIRVCLLDNLPLMIDHLPQKLVNDKIFPHMVNMTALKSHNPDFLFPSLSLCTMLNRGRWKTSGLGLYRHRAGCARADHQGCPDRHLEAVGPHHQRRAAQVPCQDGERRAAGHTHKYHHMLGQDCAQSRHKCEALTQADR